MTTNKNSIRSVLALCSLCLCGESLLAASPQLVNIQPRGAQRGAELVLLFNGTNLADAQEVFAYDPGITVKKVEVVNPTQVKVAVAVAADCRLGEHAFRLRTASGVSDLRSFWVGALPVIDETEPNNEFEKPQPIPLNVTVHGVIANEDQDYFAVECKKGQRLAVEIEGQRLGGGFFDPYVAILDAKRFELATSDDQPRLGQDGNCAIVVPEDGKYVVQVRESAYGNGNQYRLHVGTFPAPTAVIPAGGKPGEEVEFRFVGDPTGEIKRKVKLPAAADPNFRLHCETPEGVSPSGFPMRVVDLPTAPDGPNTNGGASAVLPVPGAANGVIAAPGENRWYKFAAKKGQTFDIHCYGRRLGSPLDPVMHVMVVGGKYLAGSDDNAGPDSYLRFTAPDDAEYYLWVHDHLTKGGPTYAFRIEITPIQPEAILTIPKVDGNNPNNQDRQWIAVPKGNRFASLVSITRKDFGGPLTVGFDNLPPGMALAADQLDAGQSVLPVVFEAAPDAAVGGTLGAFTATHADPKHPPVPSRTTMDSVFNVGINQTVFCRRETDRVAAAVAEPAPYSIEVIEPKAPVLQNGSFNLRVVAKRAEGFKGAITVYPLWSPPGVGIQGAATIAEGATEAFLPTNAAPNAPTRKWKTAVIASAGTPTGVVWVSSQLFALEVAPPAVTLALERAAAEQGKPVQVFGKVEVARPFDGEAVVRLLGLPAKATTPEQKITKDSKELTFPVATDSTTPAGKHGVFCQVVVSINGEQVVQNVGGAELRIDVPLPAKPAAPAAEAKKPEPAQPAAAAPKRLSRLEQLRQEQAAKEK